MIHIYNGILLYYKKDKIILFAVNTDGPRDCHTEWSKSGREIQIYDIIYM